MSIPKTQKIYYKVVRGFTSKKGKREWCSSYADDDLTVFYQLQKWTIHKIRNSRLFVFNKINNARDFVKKRSPEYDPHVFECEVEDPRHLMWVSNTHYGFNPCDIRHFWTWHKAYYSNSPHILLRPRVIYPPAGSVSVKAVKLIREVI